MTDYNDSAEGIIGYNLLVLYLKQCDNVENGNDNAQGSQMVNVTFFKKYLLGHFESSDALKGLLLLAYYAFI